MTRDVAAAEREGRQRGREECERPPPQVVDDDTHPGDPVHFAEQANGVALSQVVDQERAVGNVEARIGIRKEAAVGGPHRDEVMAAGRVTRDLEHIGVVVDGDRVPATSGKGERQIGAAGPDIEDAHGLRRRAGCERCDGGGTGGRTARQPVEPGKVGEVGGNVGCGEGAIVEQLRDLAARPKWEPRPRAVWPGLGAHGDAVVGLHRPIIGRTGRFHARGTLTRTMTATVPPGTGAEPAEGAETRHRRVVIIGSGPAGLTAAIYAARANLEPLVIAGNVPMGQLMITSDVENYPGFPDGVQGPEIMQKFREQAERFGSTIIEKDATRVDLSSRPFGVWVGADEYRADALIVATGASALWLGLQSEEEFRGRGVSACATCDGFFFRGREIAVVGGGDTALEEATFLTRFAEKVTMLVRRGEFRGSKIMQDRALNHPKIEVLWNKEVAEVKGDMTVNALTLRDTKTGEASELAVQGLFIAIGYKPNTDLFEGQLDIGPGGYLDVVGETGSRVEGVFIAGDVHDHHYRQAVTAAGDGCKAAIDAERWLASVGEIEPATATNW